MRYLIAMMLSAALMLPATFAHSQTYKNPAGHLAGQLGAGFAIGPGDPAASMAMSLEYYITNNLSIVPRFTIDVQSNARFYTITGDLRYTVPVSADDRFQVFGEGGAGVAIGDGDRPVGDDTAFQFEFGAGANYFFTDRAAIGTEALITVPIDFYGDDFAFQWQVVTLKYIF